MQNKWPSNDLWHILGIALMYGVPPALWLFFANNVIASHAMAGQAIGFDRIPVGTRLACSCIMIADTVLVAQISRLVSRSPVAAFARALLAIFLSWLGLEAAIRVANGEYDPVSTTALVATLTLGTVAFYWFMDEIVGWIPLIARSDKARETAPPTPVRNPKPNAPPKRTLAPSKAAGRRMPLRLAAEIGVTALCLALPILSWQRYGRHAAYTTIAGDALDADAFRAALTQDVAGAIVAVGVTFACGWVLFLWPRRPKFDDNPAGFLMRLAVIVIGLGTDAYQGILVSNERANVERLYTVSVIGCLLVSTVLAACCWWLGGYPPPRRNATTDRNGPPDRHDPPPGPDEIVLDGRRVRAYTDEEWSRLCAPPRGQRPRR